jgi:hypothetical protein
MRWFYAQGNQRYGPLLYAQLSQLAATGVLRAGDWVFQEGTERWVAAREVARLLPGSQPAPEATLSPLAVGLPSAMPVRVVQTEPRKPAERSHLKMVVAIGGLSVAAAAVALMVSLILRGGDGGSPGSQSSDTKKPGDEAGQAGDGKKPGGDNVQAGDTKKPGGETVRLD